MMNRRVFLLTSAGALLSASSGLAAATPEDLVARDLTGAGFRITSRERTLLGRVRFVAVRGETEREVVLDPSSGEILRDFSRDSSRGAGLESSGDGSAASGEPSGGGEGHVSGEGGGEPSGGGETATHESTSEPTHERSGSITRDVSQ
ncbi:MAG TPA: hypothetical protein PLI43_07490 [Albidovulum sp.]|uniref:hypothetical protein n=1 Tax=Albidovulum sp. TaxID=1872424 RepID=UPI002B527B28|nr:hypothetical protein [Albidovulum sp.]